MFGTSGVRGSIGETITADLAVAMGRAVATAGADTVVVGRDPRTTGPLLRDALSAGAREAGADVVDLGTVGTPTLARSVAWVDADVGVMVTASHNPPEDNGFKLWTPSGKAIGPDQQRAIEAIVDRDIYEPAAWDEVGRVLDPPGDVEGCHRRILEDAAGDLSGLSVVLDVGNGAGTLTAEALSGAGADVRTLDAQADGRFPGRPSEPTAEALSGLATVVEGTDADLGIAHDGDADRTVAVDETGEVVPGDQLLGVFAREAASAGDWVAVPVDTSVTVEDALDEVNAETVYTRVGDVHVAETVTDEGFVFGGEPSGAYIWPDETLCPDGPLAACRLASIVSERGPLSAVLEDVPEYPIRRENVDVEEPEATMRAVHRITEDRFGDVDDTDGAYVRFEDGWILVRASGTQSLVRVTAEARDPDRADALLKTALDVVERCRKPASEAHQAAE